MPYAWIVWLIIGALLIAGEVLTSGFFLLWFGIGALVAAALALLGVGSVTAQLIAFLVVSTLLVIASRTIFERFLTRATGEREIRSGVETMIGQVGTVVEASRGALHEGAVKIYGSVWTAYPIEGEEPLAEGESVRVERVEGNAIYVRRKTRRALLFSETT
jgi:membrane protein implicated in regulation of membrane protease activity